MTAKLMGDTAKRQKLAKPEPPDPRWIPVWRGPIYCSPACGFDCKHADYLKAIDNGDKLARLCSKTGYGEFWQREVWENMGWHYSAHTTTAALENASIAIHKSSPKRYWADIQTADPQTGYHRQFEAHGETPKLAIEAALSKARTQWATINGLFESLRLEAGGKKK